MARRVGGKRPNSLHVLDSILTAVLPPLKYGPNWPYGVSPYISATSFLALIRTSGRDRHSRGDQRRGPEPKQPPPRTEYVAQWSLFTQPGLADEHLATQTAQCHPTLLVSCMKLGEH